MTSQTRSFSLSLSSPLTIFILISFIEIYLPPVLLKPPEWQLLFSGSPQPIYSPHNEVQAVYLLLCCPAFGSQIFHLKKARQRCHDGKKSGSRVAWGLPSAAEPLPSLLGRDTALPSWDDVTVRPVIPWGFSSRPSHPTHCDFSAVCCCSCTRLAAAGMFASFMRLICYRE